MVIDPDGGDLEPALPDVVAGAVVAIESDEFSVRTPLTFAHSSSVAPNDRSEPRGSRERIVRPQFGQMALPDGPQRTMRTNSWQAGQQP
jgi:hypothetical protein